MTPSPVQYPLPSYIRRRHRGGEGGSRTRDNGFCQRITTVRGPPVFNALLLPTTLLLHTLSFSPRQSPCFFFPPSFPSHAYLVVSDQVKGRRRLLGNLSTIAPPVPCFLPGTILGWRFLRAWHWLLCCFHSRPSSRILSGVLPCVRRVPPNALPRLSSE